MFDKTALDLRERSGFEALDGGLLLYRKYFITIQSGIFPLYLPFIIAIGFVPRSFLWIPALALWLFTPLLGHLALRPIAHTFFQLPGKAPWKGTLRGALGNVTWRRFSPWRHYILPVRVLEGLQGKRLRKRISYIRGGDLGTAFALNAVVFVCIIGMIGGMIVFTAAMFNFVPFAFHQNLDFQSPGVWHAVVITYALLLGLFEPAAAAMGFALYINRRVSLEGWDLEIAFSRWADRLSNRGTGLLVLLILLILPFKPAGLNAAERISNTVPKESLESVLSDKDFGGERERTGLRWKTTPEADESVWKNLFNSLGRNRPSFAAETLRILVIALIAAALIFLVWMNRGSLSAVFHRRIPVTEKEPPPITSPPSVAGYNRIDARNLYNKGLIREAWAMMYAGAVEAAERNIDDTPGFEATEGEWIRCLKTSSAAVTVPASTADSSAFSQAALSPKRKKSWAEIHGENLAAIIDRWRIAAYAHRDPGESAFREALAALDALDGFGGEIDINGKITHGNAPNTEPLTDKSTPDRSPAETSSPNGQGGPL